MPSYLAGNRIKLVTGFEWRQLGCLIGFVIWRTLLLSISQLCRTTQVFNHWFPCAKNWYFASYEIYTTYNQFHSPHYPPLIAPSPALHLAKTLHFTGEKVNYSVANYSKGISEFCLQGQQEYGGNYLYRASDSCCDSGPTLPVRSLLGRTCLNLSWDKKKRLLSANPRKQHHQQRQQFYISLLGFLERLKILYSKNFLSEWLIK